MLNSHTFSSGYFVRSPTTMVPRVIVSSPMPTPIPPSTLQRISSLLQCPPLRVARVAIESPNMKIGPIHAQLGPLRDLSNRVGRHQPRAVTAIRRNPQPSSVGIA